MMFHQDGNGQEKDAEINSMPPDLTKTITKDVYIMTTKEIEAKVRELRSLTALIEEAQAEAEAIKDTIKAMMGNSEAIQAGKYKITYKAVTSSRIDTAALKKALPDIAEAFTKQTTTRRFCVA